MEQVLNKVELKKVLTSQQADPRQITAVKIYYNLCTWCLWIQIFGSCVENLKKSPNLTSC